MKNMLLPLILFGILVFFACQKDKVSEPFNELASKSMLNKAAPDQELILTNSVWDRDSGAKPFKAKFFTLRVPEKLGEVNCENPALPAPNYQEGEGTAAYLGRCSVVITFCSGAGGVYGGGSGYMAGNNGDTLFIKIDQGQVILPLPEPHPVYDAYFQDPFEFTGGTGRFEGASGSGMTNSLVDLWDEDHPFPGPIIPNHRTDHLWTGTLILPND